MYSANLVRPLIVNASRELPRSAAKTSPSIVQIAAERALSSRLETHHKKTVPDQKETPVIKYPPDCRDQVLPIKNVEFPLPTGLQCNMMPFRMGDKSSLPEKYQTYWHLIEACEVPKVEIGEIGYLTVTESSVEKNATQRRPGIHVEKHPNSGWGGGGWGGGVKNGSGLYMASNIARTCRVWNCYVETPKSMGDCSHLKDLLKNPIDMKANQLVWLTDSCPHEALAQEERGMRQFFRLVTSHVDLWYKAHSTPNPLVV